jgi:hypothetical protein
MGELKKMNNQKILKIAGVLLLSALMLIPASAALANTKKLTTMTTEDFTGGTHPASREIVWDNGEPAGSFNGMSSQFDTAYPFQSQVADDFILESETNINDVHWWGMFWNPGAGPNPADFNIIFYADAGGMPTGAGMNDPTSTALKVYFMPQVMGVEIQTDVYEYDVTLPEPFVASANTYYWIAIQWVGDFQPQWGFATNGDNPEYGVSALQGFPLLGTPYWTDHGYGDQAFYLTSTGPDTEPPVTTCTVTGTTEKTITLTATDDSSGVAYTKYKLDAGAWTNYTAAFVVSEIGDHVVYFYSVDYAGNVEEEKNQAFTVPAPITITIKGGLGVSAIIKNTGTTDLTDIDWTIDLDGKLIFVGKTKSGTIDTLAAGAEVTVKDFVIGFGKTGIAVTAGAVEASASGTALLIFVIGVA